MNPLHDLFSATRGKTIAVAALVIALITPHGRTQDVFAQDAQDAPTPDKGRYTLFNPVPVRMMRELSPDRPDKTESPYTVDAGHFQLEMDFANFTYDNSGGMVTQTWNMAPFNVKVGLLNNTDLQLVFDDYLFSQTKDNVTRTVTRKYGVGDLTLRLKLNLWGDDQGTTALGILPFVKMPTNTGGLGNNAVEGGTIVPLAVKLPADVDMGCETAVLVLRNENGAGYHGDFVNSITFDHRLFRALSGYVEFFSDISGQAHAGWIGTVDAGLELAVADNLQFDCGCNFGVTDAADQYNPFAGVSIRF